MGATGAGTCPCPGRCPWPLSFLRPCLAWFCPEDEGLRDGVAHKPHGIDNPVACRPLPTLPDPLPDPLSDPLPQPGGFFVALFDYQARTAEDLSFVAGARLQVLDRSHPGWWLARLLGHSGADPGLQRQGYVPSNYLAKDQSLQAEQWFFGAIKRVDAEKQLLYSGNEPGAFLIRESESQKGDYSLSVLDGQVVKHYHIKSHDEGGFFLTDRCIFPTLKSFVDHYSTDRDGLCIRLRDPCLKKKIPAPFDLSYMTSDQWEIDHSSLQLLKHLGSGQFGEVWEGLWNNTTSVAVKMLKPGSMNPTDFLREAQILKNLRHPNVIQLYAVCTLEDPIYIITELMRHGSLQEYLQNDGGCSILLTQQLDMAIQVAAGMTYLESQNYIHRDLAARNVLVGDHSTYKVADFGLSRVFKPVECDKGDPESEGGIYEEAQGMKLPVKWMAPEAIHAKKFSIKSDVWSFGILLYEIMTYGKTPYTGMNGAMVIQKLNQGFRLPLPPNCPLPLYDIMVRCWASDPKERPGFGELYDLLEDLSFGQ
ncbi:tyrosine-protein kinase FRK [Tachyglossus aculeatus]|uniref:tyrosine-protein kinase FRK n=1 Tax=Tachyglossus aculeatus TaxID=9261 RepID=UPI0018F50D6B|nr:tyrosine-protein kinase FRK [Tachyglossus aculeatus]